MRSLQVISSQQLSQFLWHLNFERTREPHPDSRLGTIYHATLVGLAKKYSLTIAKAHLKAAAGQDKRSAVFSSYRHLQQTFDRSRERSLCTAAAATVAAPEILQQVAKHPRKQSSRPPDAEEYSGDVTAQNTGMAVTWLGTSSGVPLCRFICRSTIQIMQTTSSCVGSQSNFICPVTHKGIPVDLQEGPSIMMCDRNFPLLP